MLVWGLMEEYEKVDDFNNDYVDLVIIDGMVLLFIVDGFEDDGCLDVVDCFNVMMVVLFGCGGSFFLLVLISLSMMTMLLMLVSMF